jgi:hypothetical protein
MQAQFACGIVLAGVAVGGASFFHVNHWQLTCKVHGLLQRCDDPLANRVDHSTTHLDHQQPLSLDQIQLEVTTQQHHHRLSCSGPATCTHSAGKSLLLRPVLLRGDGLSGVAKPIAIDPSALDRHWRVYAWDVRSWLVGRISPVGTPRLIDY